MSATDDRTTQLADLASLFERVTGTETVVERQQTDAPSRLDDEEGRQLSAYLHDATTATGLDDTIDEHESY